MAVELKQPRQAYYLFEGWHETMILPCFEGVTGSVYANDAKTPVSAMAAVGDFCFFAGKPDADLCRRGTDGGRRDFSILVPKDESWADLIEAQYGSRAKKVMRYAMKKAPGGFDEKALRAAADSLPDGFEMKLTDRKLFDLTRKADWCRDWTAQYEDYDAFLACGLGAVVLKDGEPVSGASSYFGSFKGIEIQIDTREDFRRQGLAYACGAKLILECLRLGLYPGWDAQNPWSAALAKKLGYCLDFEYAAYEVRKAEYEYESVIYAADKPGGAYVAFPYDVRAEFGKGRAKIHATFDGEPYDGSVVNMGVKNEDGSVRYIIGIRKDIRSKIGKQPGDKVFVTVRERQ